MSARPSNDAIVRYLEGEPIAEVESWLDADASAAAELDAIPLTGVPSRVEPMPTIPGYRLMRELGRGGMGVVYLAHHEVLARDVAVKVIHPKWAVDPEFRSRFGREGRLLATVPGSDHVVTVHDAGEHDGRPFLVMQYFEGVNFEQWLTANEGRVVAADVLWVAEHMLTGLKSIHGVGLVHRDIKPGNLCVVKGTIKIIDFGVATHAGKETITAGTLDSMAPEVVKGGDATAKSDLYSVGLLLYRMATGDLPSPGLSLAERLQKLERPELAKFILWLLAPEPACRPESAQAALAEVKAIRDRKPPTNPWVWMTIGLSATLGVVVAGLVLVLVEQARTVERVRAEQARIVGQIRETEGELDRGLAELSTAVNVLNDARAVDLHGQADANARQKAAQDFNAATQGYNKAKAKIDDARLKRAELLDRLGSMAAMPGKNE